MRETEIIDAGERDLRAELRETLERIKGRVKEVVPDQPPCPETEPGEFCNGLAHYDRDPVDRGRPGEPLQPPVVLRRCPVLVRRDVRHQMEAERKRLAGMLEQAGGGTFEGYDPDRHPKAREALQAACLFSRGRPPRRSVILHGQRGLGKTRLALASHFELLRAGVRSCFVGTTDLLEIASSCDSFVEDAREEGQRARQRLLLAEVIHWDDVGDRAPHHVTPSKSVAPLVKLLLDRSRAWWFLTTNLTGQQVQDHPDVGERILDRLLRDGPDGPPIRVSMEGRSQRRAR